jgi:DNA polymerase-3 subunit epsilon
MEPWIILVAGLIAVAAWIFGRPPARDSHSVRQSRADPPSTISADETSSPKSQTQGALPAQVPSNPADRSLSDAWRSAIVLNRSRGDHRGQRFQCRATGRFVVLDFETTGLNPFDGARVIEVSAREIVDGCMGQEFVTFVDPGIDVPPEITALTGITTSMIRGAPRPHVVMRELVTFIGGAPLVGHNVAFDRRFLHWEVEAVLNRAELQIGTICTMRLARRVFPGRPSYRLGSIIQDIGISESRLHRASADTLVTAELFGKICDNIHGRCGPTVIDHNLLMGLQTARIASADAWLRRQAASSSHRIDNSLRPALGG